MLAQNTVFSDAQHNRYRILHVALDAQKAYIISLVAKNALPQAFDWTALLNAEQSGEVVKATDECIATAFGELADTALKARDRRWELIKDLTTNPQIFECEGRGRLIEEHAARAKASPQTIMTCLRLYWLGGQTEDALVPAFHLRGQAASGHTHPARRRAQTSGNDKPAKSRGREPTKKSGYARTYVFEGQARADVIKLGLSLYRDKNVTMHKLYRTIVDKLFCDDPTGNYKKSGGTERKWLVKYPLGERPTPRQVRYALKGQLTKSERVIRDTSTAQYINDSKPKTGTVFDTCVCVGHSFEIDSTIVDVLLVAEENRMKIVGKATLYLIVDTFSRLIVGMHLTLDKPSWAGALEAILTLVEDKEKLCQRWGAEFVPEAWVASGILPSKFIADRGTEFVCGDSNKIAKGVGSALVNAPSRLSSRKGMVEMSFHLIHVCLKEETAGYMDPTEAEKRQREDVSKDARYHLKALGAEILDAVTLRNLKVQKNYRMDNVDVWDEAEASPAAIWTRDYARSAGHMGGCSHEHLRWKLLPSGFANVTQLGLSINHCLYGEENGRFHEWFVADGRKEAKVWVTYDRRLVDTIWVHNADNPRASPIPVELNSHSRNLKGKQVSEVEAMFAISGKLSALADEHNLDLELLYQRQCEARRANADAEYEKAKADATDRSRIDTHGEWRDAEASRDRQQLAARFNATNEPLQVPQANPPPESIEPEPHKPADVKPRAKKAQVEMEYDDSVEALMSQLVGMVRT